MKAKRLLFLVMAICLASGVKAQFYDGPDDIYYYVEEYYEYEETTMKFVPYVGYQTVKTGDKKKVIPSNNERIVYIFNFDGKKAANLSIYSNGSSVEQVKSNMQESSSYYEDKVETTDYKWEFVSSSYSETIYRNPGSTHHYSFSSDRNTLSESWFEQYGTWAVNCERLKIYKRVVKSFFRVGRSRTPSGTMHE